MDARKRMHELVDELCDLAIELHDVDNYATIKERAKVRFEQADKIWNDMYEKMRNE